MRFFTYEIDTGAGARSLRAYLPDATADSNYRGRRPAVIVFPGGAYSITYEGEAEPIALSFAAAGIGAFVLDYSVTTRTKEVYPNALLEAFSAVRYVRSHAGEFGLDPANIATLGFSAGGHLCACTGTLWNKPVMAPYLGEDARASRPDKLILCYPVIRSEEPCHRGSFINLFGCAEKLTPELLRQFSLERQVDDDTPPAFLWATSEDTAVPVQGALEFAHALADHRIHAEMHLYPHGGHGLCLANAVTGKIPFGEEPIPSTWIRDAIRFLYDENLTAKIR